MENIHSLLKRQLKRFFSDPGSVPAESREFVKVVNEAYRSFDVDREMLERALDLSSHELLSANSQMRAVFQAIPDLLFRLDHDGTILDFKAGATGDFVVPPRDLLGKRIQDIPVKHVGEQFGEAISRACREKTIVTIEYSLPDRESFYEARLVPLPEHQIVAIIRNITERKRTEEELYNSRQMLRTVLDTIPQRVFWKDRNSVYVGCNKPLANDCGYKDPSELIGKTDYETMSAATADLYRADDRQVMETGRAKLNYEEPQMKADGTQGWLRTSKAPLYDKDGNVIGVLGTYEDTTEHKILEEQFRQSQKMEAFGQLAAGVAHDFNNILMVIQGYVSLLQARGISAEDRTASTTGISHAVERAANLTRQLLTFSRRQPMQPRALDLNEIVVNMTKMLQRLIGEHIALEARYAAGGAPVHADPGMLEQVLINLAVNSRDAMPKGGRLVIETSTATLTETAPQKDSARSGEFIRLSVTDTGMGIAPENLPHIFEPFFTTKEIGKGTGLGLATVFGIVEQHRGWIDVESKPGAGTTFNIFLPRSTQAAVKVEEAPPPKVRGGNETVLLVEDDSAVRELLRGALERHGYRVHEARSGAAALKLWPKHRTDIRLLVTDMVMPEGINGRELADRLKTEKPGLKVIYCSGYTDEMLGAESPLRNNVNFLEKPFDPHRFLKHVRDCLDER